MAIRYLVPHSWFVESKSKEKQKIKITSFKELDDFVEKYDIREIYDVYDNRLDYLLDFEAFLNIFPGGRNNFDPFSPEYRNWEMHFFEFIAGGEYNMDNEGMKYSRDVKENTERHPMSLHSEVERIEIIRRILDFIQIAGINNGEKVLEMGCGDGHLAAMLDAWGTEYWGIDISDYFIDCARRRVYSEDAKKRILKMPFQDIPKLNQKFDTIIFESAFHHCGNPVEMLEIIHKNTTDNARIILWREPIMHNADRPWGLIRDDGETIYQIRKRGWLEFGWTMDFLLRMFKKTGWRVTKHDEKSEFLELKKI